MKVTYIGHSGFLIESGSCCCLFDYYQGEIPSMPEDKPLYIFVSHRHQDHFNPEIFQVSGPKEIHYILSQDTRRYMRDRLSLPNLHFMKAEESLALTETGSGKSLSVKTLHSTDCGVAFLAEYQGKKIYHAGDLNWWVWKGESKQEYNNMTASYQREIGLLKEKAGQIDVAFAPLDPRQEEWYRLGMDYFLGQIDVQTVFPMHFWGDYSVITRYQEEQPQYASRVIPLSREGYEVVM